LYSCSVSSNDDSIFGLGECATRETGEAMVTLLNEKEKDRKIERWRDSTW
jgi:hypothetical protein